MKSIFKKITITLSVLVATIGVGLAISAPAFATEQKCTNVLDSSWCDKEKGEGITEAIKFFLGIMTAGLFVAATAGCIWCGIMITSARDDAAQVSKARKRMIEIVIGLVAWILSAVVITLLLPQGDQTGMLGTGGTIVTKVGN